EIDAGAEPEVSHRLHQPGDAAVKADAEPGQNHVGSAQGSRSEDRVDLATQTTAGDEDQPLDALRKLIAELQCYTAAERVSDDGGLLLAEGVEQVAKQIRVRAQRIVAGWLGRGAMTEEIWGNHQMVLDQSRHHPFPSHRAGRNAMEQNDGRTASCHPITVSLAVKLDVSRRDGLF